MYTAATHGDWQLVRFSIIFFFCIVFAKFLFPEERSRHGQTGIAGNVSQTNDDRLNQLLRLFHDYGLDDRGSRPNRQIEEINETD
jgi:hypothetical protein